MIFKPAATHVTPAQQAAMSHARRRNTMARAAAQTAFNIREGVTRERQPIDNEIDQPIDNPGD